MTAPEPVTTVEEILSFLNKDEPGLWAKLPDHFGISVPEIKADTSINFGNPSGGVVLIMFVNTKTAETKSFVAKYTDDPVREKLW